MKALIMAFSTYSRIPMPNVEFSEKNQRASLCFFPLIGIVIGLCQWLLMHFFSFLPLRHRIYVDGMLTLPIHTKCSFQKFVFKSAKPIGLPA